MPHLYEVVFEARRDGGLLDRKSTRTGIREVAFDREAACIWVNHHRVFLKGVLYDDPHWMSLMTPAGYRQRLELMQRANLNTIRMVTHQSAPAMYALADEMGMLIWQEMPLQLGYASSEPVRRDIMAICRDTVLQTRSHASVIGWSAWNEGGQGEFTDRLAAMIRDLDPTGRPVSEGSGSGHFDIHTYANLSPWLCHRTALWTGTRARFISEIGAYALSSPAEMNRLVGRKWFPFDTADYYWETFNEYRYNCGPVFREGPSPQPNWGAKEELEYVNALQPASERWLCQYMKYAYENFRGQRFDPCNALIHCRFDDAMPSAYLGLVNYNGEPRKALDAMGEACQAVVPILYFDFQGAQDVRVVNDYWFRSWHDCTLEYRLTTWDGKVLTEGRRKFDLPAEATVRVLERGEIGDVWSQPGLRAELKLLDAKGGIIARNQYDLTEKELRAFITSVYPPAPGKTL